MKSFLVTEPQAGRVPFWGLLFLALAYTFTGLVGRDPWRGDDAVGLGVAFNMLLALQAGDFDAWLISQLPGVLLPDEGPLPFWLASILGLITAKLPIDFALVTRLCWVGSWLATLVFCWQAVYRLSRRPEWIPHDPIGIAATPRRLAASLADSSVLFLLATVGLVERVHETSPEAFSMCIMAAGFFCLAWSLDSPRRAGWALGAVTLSAWLCKGLWFAFVIPLSLATLTLTTAHWRGIATILFSRIALVMASSLGLWFWLLMRDSSAASGQLAGSIEGLQRAWLTGWWHIQLGGPAQGLGTRFYDLIREPWWFFWPVWPVAFWAIWSLGERWREPSLVAPLGLMLATFALSPIAPGSSLAWLMPVSVPLAALAAMGLPSLRRSLVQFIDWYAVLIYGLIALMFWAYYLAWLIGWPEKMAYRMGVLARADQASIAWLGALTSLAVSLAWVSLVAWRLSRQPAMLWKPVLLASSGLVLIWFLFQTLFLEAHNTRNSYREMAMQARAVMQSATGCVIGEQLRPAVQASLQWFAGLEFSNAPHCPWLLIQDSGEALRYAAPARPGWQLHWAGARRGENQERFRLYLRQETQKLD